jgi:NAD+ kinase
VTNSTTATPSVPQDTPREIACLGLVVKPGEPRGDAIVATLARWADARGVQLLLDQVEDCDLLVVLGGDGTMLRAAQLLQGRPTPVLGVNLGTLGYLTEFGDNELADVLDEVLAGKHGLDRRLQLECSIVRDGVETWRALALNDMVITSPLARLVEMECWVDGEFVTCYRADGLVVSTPTGSTAYNLSAGGPLLMPLTPAIVVNPICPHTLTNRPLVMPDSVRVELALRSDRVPAVAVTVDGQVGHELSSQDRVIVQRSPSTFNLVLPRDRSYFEVLRRKLRWGGQLPGSE